MYGESPYQFLTFSFFGLFNVHQIIANKIAIGFCKYPQETISQTWYGHKAMEYILPLTLYYSPSLASGVIFSVLFSTLLEQKIIPSIAKGMDRLPIYIFEDLFLLLSNLIFYNYF